MFVGFIVLLALLFVDINFNVNFNIVCFNFVSFIVFLMYILLFFYFVSFIVLIM